MNREDLLIFEAYKKGKTKKADKKTKKSEECKDVCNCSEEGTCEPCKKKSGKRLENNQL